MGVIILNYNSYSDTIKLVCNLGRQTIAAQLHIVVVDNASPNGAYEELKPLESQYDNVTVLQTGENLGYAKGNNFGLEFLKKNISPDYVAILNNDIILPDDCLESLCRRYEELDAPAIIAPMMTTPDGKRARLSKMNTFFDDFIGLFYCFRALMVRRTLKERDTTGHRAMRVDMIPGSFMFIRFDTFEKMGFFYPNTFLYVEERFVAVAAKELGLHNYILLDRTYIHAHNSPTISSVYSVTNKYRLLYDSRLEFTRTRRKNGRLKAAILKPVMLYSIWEIGFVEKIKKIFR